MSAPPPMPPTASAHAPPPPARAPKQGMSGCAIAAIIGAVVVVLGIVVAGILAAIALPAYQQYVTKSHVAQALQMAQELQDDVDAHREQSGACPDNAAIGLADDEAFTLSGGSAATPGQASVLVGEIEGGHCGIELQFANVNAAVDGKTLLLESTDNGWVCDGGTLDAKYRTGSCRRSNASP
jgi:type IV pilus assembly protein PilA